ncbi:lipoate--protein ligase [Aerococcus sp. Group 2]|uniref:lipoate--protein ligase n=1 Tax=Aerococcus sp. Group 2 TaxID=2976811 RepID=UPI00227AAA40|nr:lipoate--protein ligase [Aerococcus sp. Group 2]MCY3040274.1 lipoate--protein ligase [Aerococcus sp. Group 2]MCY3043667.1 lipoate--protein ligase [Aerococcus sp. Group 2]
MYLIDLKRDGQRIYDGALALAAQVYAQSHIFLDEDILFPYMCDPKVEIGKYQNARAEVNQDYIDQENIQVVRRDTGGGAVYCDRGAINVCFLADHKSNDLFGNFEKMYQPGIKALEDMGVEGLHTKGRNDMYLGDKKVSGAAMTLVGDRVYGGFSLLFDIDAEAMVKALNPNQKKIISKGIKSVKSRVAPIRPALAPEFQAMSMDELFEALVCRLFGVEDFGQIKQYELTEEDWQGIDQLAKEKYKNWDWNYGKAPQYTYNRDDHFDQVGTVEISIEVEEGKISQCKIWGDFFGQAYIAELEEQLIGVKMRRDDLLKALEDVQLENYISHMTPELLVDLILS